MNDEAPLARYETSLRGLARKNRLRTLAARAGTDFASNDYLGLAASQRLGAAIAAALAGTPVGTGGSRLLRGNCPEHEAVEAAAAAFFRAERAPAGPRLPRVRRAPADRAGGHARLRVSLTLNVDEAAITALFDALAEAMRSLAA